MNEGALIAQEPFEQPMPHRGTEWPNDARVKRANPCAIVGQRLAATATIGVRLRLAPDEHDPADDHDRCEADSASDHQLLRPLLPSLLRSEGGGGFLTLLDADA